MSTLQTEPFFENLEHLLEHAAELRLKDDDKLVIFSDLHLGDGSTRDDFLRNSGIFTHILRDYYLEHGYTLFLNGDVEELHRYPLRKIRRRWGEIYELFDEFSVGNGLYKLIGNHDHNIRHMASEEQRYSHYEAVRLQYGQGMLFIFHGHQASMFYEKHNDLTGYLLKYLANPLRIKNSSVAHDSKKRFLIERRAYEFSSTKKILSIIGHTHRPLFESLSKMESLKFQIEYLCRAYPSAEHDERVEIERRIQEYKVELFNLYTGKERRKRRSTLYNTHLVVPCLFNSGCVIGKRGITALEIGNEEIRLVHWLDAMKQSRYKRPTMYEPEIVGRYTRSIQNRDLLENVFTRIRLLT